jgi:hypothetical protein
MPEFFLCLTCERSLEGTPHIRGYKTFLDVQANFDHYFAPEDEGDWEMINCSFCGNPINIIVEQTALNAMPVLEAPILNQ